MAEYETLKSLLGQTFLPQFFEKKKRGGGGVAQTVLDPPFTHFVAPSP